MEAAQNEYQKKMAAQQQQQFFSIYTDKLRSKSKPFSFSCSPLRPKRDVHFFLSSDENKDSKATNKFWLTNPKNIKNSPIKPPRAG